MIQYTNIKRYDNKDFKDYLHSPGYSYTFIKKEKFGIKIEFKETDKMLLGSLVDKMLTDPNKADISSPLYPMAKGIYKKIKTDFPYLQHFSKQVMFCADACCGEFYIPVKGRLDYLFEGNAVIDLKITHSKDIMGVIKHFEYKEQLWNYCKMAQVNKGYLFVYSVPLDTTRIIEVDCSSNNSLFWETAILAFGNVNK